MRIIGREEGREERDDDEPARHEENGYTD